MRVAPSLLALRGAEMAAFEGELSRAASVSRLQPTSQAIVTAMPDPAFAQVQHACVSGPACLFGKKEKDSFWSKPLLSQPAIRRLSRHPACDAGGRDRTDNHKKRRWTRRC
ncbi:hypothetical protein N2603_10540 [Bradyrhizobium huanghuaihaiense]|uniref:hypothetical protein n=1 Tax=Bradyrhizobium huanghuaihaiense TaxID=990078 RepID=UPI0021AA0E51|nr:hypothetical protein [Bradyrhizobium sp. CB3035]UWU78865.1 hypothetical protein N2603_10540 [Bradyrhizobium sp. CB3035]